MTLNKSPIEDIKVTFPKEKLANVTISYKCGKKVVFRGLSFICVPGVMLIKGGITRIVDGVKKKGIHPALPKCSFACVETAIAQALSK